MSLLVHVIAPTGRDAELIVTVLQQNGVAASARTLEHSSYILQTMQG